MIFSFKDLSGVLYYLMGDRRCMVEGFGDYGVIWIWLHLEKKHTPYEKPPAKLDRGLQMVV